MNDTARVPYDSPWPIHRLKDLTSKIGSGATPTGGESSYLSERVRWALVRSQNVYDWKFDFGGLAFITDEQARRLSGVTLRPRDVLLNITGASVGRSCQVPEAVLPACVNQHVAIIRANEERLDAGYLSTYLTHPDVKPYIESFDSGGSRQGITKGHIESFAIPLPPLETQKAIARILGALDDKIELNRRMNCTLEALAQKLFKSWFVDFEPVLAKSQNRKPFGLSDEIAALFPDAFEDSELGPIPKGWRVESLDTLAEFRNGLAMQKFPPGLGASLPVLKIAELRAGSTSGADQASVDLDPRYVVNDGDLIFSWSGSLMVDIWAGGQAALNQHLFKVVPNDVPQWFCHYWLLEHLEDFQGIAADKATTMGHIRRHHLSDALIVRPDEKILARADAVIAPLCERVLQNKLQSRKLAAMRDLLLPKLLSGEIRVPVAEKAVETTLL
jgi:type I restriction enzyme S subunit